MNFFSNWTHNFPLYLLVFFPPFALFNGRALVVRFSSASIWEFGNENKKEAYNSDVLHVDCVGIFESKKIGKINH